MRVIIAAVGKLKDGPERVLYTRYCERIATAGRAAGIGPLELREIVEGRAGSREVRMADEAGRLLAKTSDASVRIVLDERGTAYSSTTFAGLLRDMRERGQHAVAFMLGGADGHGDAARKAAQHTLSLGPMTLPHGLARIVLAEQIYRAGTILAGHPYHRDG